jgi:hypothetical protein
MVTGTTTGRRRKRLASWRIRSGGDDRVEPPEQELLGHARAGMRLDLAGDGPVVHEAMDQWGPERTVRAAVLRHVLVDSQWPVHSRGVRLRGARISGRLDLDSATLRCPLLLEDCHLDNPDPVALDYATADRIVLSRCRVVGGGIVKFCGSPVRA